MHSPISAQREGSARHGHRQRHGGGVSQGALAKPEVSPGAPGPRLWERTLNPMRRGVYRHVYNSIVLCYLEQENPVLVRHLCKGDRSWLLADGPPCAQCSTHRPAAGAAGPSVPWSRGRSLPRGEASPGHSILHGSSGRAERALCSPATGINCGFHLLKAFSASLKAARPRQRWVFGQGEGSEVSLSPGARARGTPLCA